MPRRNSPAASDFSAGRPALRKTGIRAIGDLPWGTHFCQFFETKQDLLDTLAAYFKAGLDDEEFCLWVIPELLTMQEALDALRRAVPDLDRRIARGDFEIVARNEWFFAEGKLDLAGVVNRFARKLNRALANGYVGMRVNGSTDWLERRNPQQFADFETELNELIAGKRMTILCTFQIAQAGAIEVLDAARTHQFTVAKRLGDWEVLEISALKRAKDEIKKLSGALAVLSRPFPGHESLTARERLVLAQIVSGASSKEAGRALSISPRTVDFHRANILQKLGAKNAADLVRIVLGESGS